MTSFTELTGDRDRPDPKDEQMDQIRELLVGDIVRRTEARIDALESRLSEAQDDIGRRLDELAERLEALGADLTDDRRASFEELSRGVIELGERIRNLSTNQS